MDLKNFRAFGAFIKELLYKNIYIWTYHIIDFNRFPKYIYMLIYIYAH